MSAPYPRNAPYTPAQVQALHASLTRLAHRLDALDTEHDSLIHSRLHQHTEQERSDHEALIADVSSEMEFRQLEMNVIEEKLRLADLQNKLKTAARQDRPRQEVLIRQVEMRIHELQLQLEENPHYQPPSPLPGQAAHSLAKSVPLSARQQHDYRMASTQA